MHTPCFVWDLSLERPTLGGALTLRQEAEILASLSGADEVDLLIRNPHPNPATFEPFADRIFGSSALRFRRHHADFPLQDQEEWPLRAARSSEGFSYFSFGRVIQFHQTLGIKPRLRWSPALSAKASSLRLNFTGRLILAHLRRVAPFSLLESNADADSWLSFFNSHARPDSQNFLLLGDDPLPPGLELPPGVHLARSLGIPLETQLALFDFSDGFVGMASGVCTAANFSSAPHVIFKHPAHHPQEMQRELGSASHFPFAEERQFLWRREADRQALDEALALLLQ